MNGLNYKVGDYVRIKDIGWYNKYKDEDGNVSCGEFSFVEGMKKFCSETLTISEDAGDGYLMLEDYLGYVWTDEMIECKVEEETKSKFKVGDKVRIKDIDWYNKNKSKSHGTVACGGKYFEYGMREWCGKTMTILEVYQTFYIMEEDWAKNSWTDEMIEGLVEELIPYFEEGTNKILYYKNKNTLECYFPMRTPEYICPEGYIFKDENGNEINAQKIVLEKANTLKTQSDNMETETHRGYYTTEEENTNESKKVAWFTFGDNDFADKVELDLSDRELIQEDGKWFAVKKKKEYPKTYEECCKVLGIDTLGHSADGYKWEILSTFQNLLICRDAYWKIAGDEMGLGEPWKPDWKSDDATYVIHALEDMVVIAISHYYHEFLAFPTEEMRDNFYDNFKKEIEICMELL